MVSFQCSRHSTPADIVEVFNRCVKFQRDRNLDKFASVVVLEDVGLAEHSENMPLKVCFVYGRYCCEAVFRRLKVALNFSQKGNKDFK